MAPGSDPGSPVSVRSSSRFLSFLGVCSLTAATLVVVGFIGEIVGPLQSVSKGTFDARSTSERLVSVGTIRRIIGRILSVGLPFYAASKLGGERVAIVALATVAAGLMSTNPTVEEMSRPVALRKLFWSRKWTVTALTLGCASDLFNLTNNSLPLQIASGYLALAVSVLLLPWPYPTKVSKMLNINSPMVARNFNRRARSTSLRDPSMPRQTNLPDARSPLIATARDTDLTIASGVLATVISFIVFVFSSQQTQTLTLNLLIGGSIVAIASALSLLFADPQTLLANKGSSLATGLGFTIIVQEIIDSHPLLPILIQGVITGFSWLGVCLDARHHSSHSHNHHHSHHSHSHAHDESVSSFTAFLLRLSEDWPLIHSILMEKDSRRILYFMR